MSLEVLQQTLIDNPDFDYWETFGEIKADYHPHYPLVLLNYTNDAMWNARWNSFERICRGLILEKGTGKVIARPFDKFFNWMEGGRVSSGYIVSITEKMDGSLGILFPYDNKYHIASRGSFVSPQAQWANDFLQYYDVSFIPENYTLLLEIIYPENRIVVNYGKREDLVLLAARNTITGEYMPKWKLSMLGSATCFNQPKPFVFNNVTDILHSLEKLTSDEEGYVVEFSDGQFFKFKGDQYLELQRIIKGITFSQILTHMEQGTYLSYLKLVPEELQPQVLMWYDKIQAVVDDIHIETAKAVQELSNMTLSRKELYQYVEKHYPKYSSFVLYRLDEKNWQRDIFKYIRQHKNEIEHAS